METTGAVAGIVALSVGGVTGLQTALASKNNKSELDEIKKIINYIIALLNDIHEKTRNPIKQDTRTLATKIAVLEGQVASLSNDLGNLRDELDGNIPPQSRTPTRLNMHKPAPSPRIKVQPSKLTTRGNNRTTNTTRRPGNNTRSPYTTSRQQIRHNNVEEIQDDSSVYAEELDPELLDALM